MLDPKPDAVLPSPVNIPDLDPNKSLQLPISPNQTYHQGPSFRELFKYVHNVYIDNTDPTVFISLVVPDELNRFNFMAELGKTSEEDEAVKELVTKLNVGWQFVNLELDEETKKLRTALEEKGKLFVFNWTTCKEIYKESFHKSSTALQTEYDKKGAYFQTVNLTATIFFEAFQNRPHIQQNPIIQHFIHTHRDFIFNLFIKYVMEECAMFGAWQLEGFTQMAYPFNYHKTNPDKTPKTNTNKALMECVTAVLATLNTGNKMNLLDIEFKPQNNHLLKPQTRSRRGSLDSRVDEKKQEEKKQITELKVTNRKLTQEIDLLVRTLTQQNPSAELPESVKRRKEKKLEKLEKSSRRASATTKKSPSAEKSTPTKSTSGAKTIRQALLGWLYPSTSSKSPTDPTAPTNSPNHEIDRTLTQRSVPPSVGFFHKTPKENLPETGGEDSKSKLRGNSAPTLGSRQTVAT